MKTLEDIKTKLDVDRLTSDEYRTLMGNPEFRKKVDELFQDAPVQTEGPDVAPVLEIPPQEADLDSARRQAVTRPVVVAQPKEDVPVQVEPVVPEQVPIDEVPAPVPPVPPVPPVEEHRYEYQPLDEQGRSLGGKQVIKYTTLEDLADKLKNQNVELVRKLREVTKKQRLGISEDEHINKDDVDKFPTLVEFTPKPLSPAEVEDISQSLVDPTKFVDARDRLLESAIGQTPETLRKTLNDQQVMQMQLMARYNFDEFASRTPEFHKCTENLDTLTDWMIKNELAPTVKSFNLAYSRLREAGLLLEAPVVREDAPKQPEPVAVVTPAPVKVENTPANAQPVTGNENRIVQSEPQQPKRRVGISSGLTSSQASSVGNSPVESTLTLAQIDNMPSAEYRRRLQDPEFRKLVDKLDAEREARQKSQLGIR